MLIITNLIGFDLLHERLLTNARFMRFHKLDFIIIINNSMYNLFFGCFKNILIIFIYEFQNFGTPLSKKVDYIYIYI